MGGVKVLCDEPVIHYTSLNIITDTEWLKCFILHPKRRKKNKKKEEEKEQGKQIFIYTIYKH